VAHEPAGDPISSQKASLVLGVFGVEGCNL
jgi:hypothetical protein